MSSSPEQAPPEGDSDSMRIFGLSQPTSYRKVCVRCGRWGYFASDKEVTKSGSNTARVPVLQTSCCQNIFCIDCILSTISDGLWDEIWRPQESGYGISISCPARSCEAQRLCLDLEGLIEFLLACGHNKRTLIGSIRCFRYAFQAQRSIHDKIPDMNEWQGKAGNDFHKQLVSAGHMWPCDGTWPCGTMMHVARFSFRGGEPIPVFLGLFKDKIKRKPCVVCDEEFMETSSGEVLNVVFYKFGDAQRTPHTGKSGFPPRSVFLDCHSQHKLNCCFRCHDHNIAAKLDNNQEITCPETDCGNILTPSQVEAVARPDTLARYDKMQLQKGLDTMPYFRWCVNEHCSAGQDNDLEGCSSEYRFFIKCNACHLPMCFLHCRVWHFGQTCEEYDKAHDLVGGRDPETDRWLLEHAKPCPGCKVPVEKNGGCFHMTCQSCKMEFCWVCLADWKKIRRFVDGRMTYDVSGHNSECDFRRTRVQPHLAIGNNVGDAIRDAEELLWLMPQ